MLRNLSRHLPSAMKQPAKRFLSRWLHPTHHALKGIGTISDLYYWTIENGVDTILPIQNYYSTLFPQFDCSTMAYVKLFDASGKLCGIRENVLVHHGLLTIPVSTIQKDVPYGTVVCTLQIPAALVDHLEKMQPFYLWDRFAIGYQSPNGHISYVHGVDKTMIHHGLMRPEPWYDGAQEWTWHPEMPVQDGYALTVIQIDRINGKVDRNAMRGLSSIPPVRLRTQWGRPLVFKTFPDGTVDVMHT